MKLRFTAFTALLSVILVVAANSLQAQIYDPVSWSFSVEDQKAGSATLVLHADIESGWHVYATKLSSDMGPIPTSFSFEESTEYALKGDLIEPKPISKYDPNFQMDLDYHDEEATFKQKIKINTEKDFTVNGTLTFMVCDAEKCLPPEDVPFSFNLKPVVSSSNSSKQEEPEPKSGAETGESMTLGQTGDSGTGILEPVTWSFEVKELGDNKFEFIATAEIDDHWHLYSQHIEGMDGPMPTEFIFEKQKGLEMIGTVEEPEPITQFDPVFEMEVSYFNESATFRQKFENSGGLEALKGSVGFMTCDDKRCIFPDPIEFDLELPGLNKSLAEHEKGDKENQTGTESSDGPDKSLIGIFLLAFFGGFAALLTPCVFPMIPMTVSFFTKQSKTRAKGITNALVYGLSIIIIYVLLGFGVTTIFGADALNALSTNVWFNLAFFALLVIFAISFFGAFEITLPSSFINKVDRNADRGGLIGIFFMAFTLALVSFSCTGPIIGTLLVEAAYVGGKSGPLIGMFGFSLALALPFALFAAFPGWLNSLPQSGGWLNSVKVVLGFLELALAFKFLSNADLVVQAGYLTREIFIAIWIGVFGVMAFYLFGAFRLPHDSPIEKLSIGRLLLGIVTIVFTIYLIPGLWGAPLKLISGFPPPQFYSESPQGVGAAATIVSGDESESHGGSEHCPHDLNCFKDYEKGLAYAKEVGKPVLLDFTGWACVNCRKMEEQVWSDPAVLKVLREEVVLVSLYVDDKRELPESEQREVTIGSKTKTLKTIGNKWSYFQASRYKSNSQPQYVLIDHDEENLIEPTAYNPDIQHYLNWLQRGIEEFNERQSS